MMPVEIYKSYWKKAKENMSCYPGDLSLATFKAGAQDDTIAQFTCIMTIIPLFSEYTPHRWKKVVDVRILKKAGLTWVNSLHSIILFQSDCNYAFKFLAGK
jgi:hypothetical protein